MQASCLTYKILPAGPSGSEYEAVETEDKVEV
jgi:hypothetical protein